jgi:hypothetical protein
MESANERRNTLLACPECGRRAGRARVCDMDFKCKNCGCEYEVIIRFALTRDPAAPIVNVPEETK